MLQSTTAETYSLASLKGDFTSQINTWPGANVAEASLIGAGTFNGKGGFTGSYMAVDDGVVNTGTTTATYTVCPDGVVSISIGNGVVGTGCLFWLRYLLRLRLRQ